MILSLIFISYSLAASPCDGVKVGYWVNPDGSRGGSVATTAKVFAGVTIGPQAQVCGESVVSGKTHIFGRAKISGKSKIHNSTICQASQIAGFDVIDSDYYCQTEDPEPTHPGEAGKKTLLGIDSDNDGVRDDVEIQINDMYSNTAKVNKKYFRKTAKLEMRSYEKLLKRRTEKAYCIEEYRNVLDAGRCVRHVYTAGLSKGMRYSTREQIFDQQHTLFNEYFNTRERLTEWNKVLRNLNGMVLEGNINDSECDAYLKNL